MDNVSIAAIASACGLSIGSLLGYLAKKEESKALRDAKIQETETQADIDTIKHLTAQCESHQKRIDALETKIDMMQARHDAEIDRREAKYEAELKRVHDQKHDVQKQSQYYLLTAISLQGEVNLLLHDQGKSVKYKMNELGECVDVVAPIRATEAALKKPEIAKP